MINRRHTLGTADLALEWAIEVEGLPVQEGTMEMSSIPPGDIALLQLPLELNKLAQPGERWLTLRFVGHAGRPSRVARTPTCGSWGHAHVPVFHPTH